VSIIYKLFLTNNVEILGVRKICLGSREEAKVILKGFFVYYYLFFKIDFNLKVEFTRIFYFWDQLMICYLGQNENTPLIFFLRKQVYLIPFKIVSAIQIDINSNT
jgi:hypothetical protein